MSGLPRVLCVDDEPAVLQGLRLQLRRDYDVTLAESPEAALRALDDGPAPAVLLSDMRMPGMDGAQLLAEAAARVPDTTRMLLTGHADFEAAARAINEGGVFRFLVKPCRGAALRDAIAAGAELYRLKQSERELLEQTLKGCLDALGEVLSMAEPRAFGHLERIDALILAAAPRLDLTDAWSVPVANVFSHLPAVTLPSETLDKTLSRRPLDGAEARMVAALPRLARSLCERIPRLEPVERVLEDAGREHPESREARLLVAARTFVELTHSGSAPDVALAALRARPGADADVIAALAHAAGEAAPVAAKVIEAKIAQLRPGMVFAEDVSLADGRLLVARGQRLTDSLCTRLRNFGPGKVREPLLVTA